MGDKPLHVHLVPGGSAETLREEPAELQDAGLQLLGTDHGHTATTGCRDAASQLRQSPGTACQQTE